MNRKVMVVAPHPDDETLGCGGTLLKYAGEGAGLCWVVVTTAGSDLFSSNVIAQQKSQVEAVRTAYPFDRFHWLNAPAAGLTEAQLPGLVRELADVAEEVRPEIVFVPNSSDVHSDHRLVFAACAGAFKSFYMKRLGIRRLLAYETLSETDAATPSPLPPFTPTTFVDISATLERKLEILELFESEIQPEPMPRTLSAVRALARVRGATVGVEAAEAFCLLREVL